MERRVIIIHGYKGKPESNWKPWLKGELESEGFKVDIPQMPSPKQPIASEWVAKLSETIGNPTPNTYLVGHSLGCITILRYLETLAEGQEVGGVIMIAGFGGRFKNYQNGSHDTFFDHELNWPLIRKRSSNFVAIHSKDDPGVEAEQLDVFKNKLGAKAILVEGMGHFGSNDGVFEFPLIKDELLSMVGQNT